MKATYRKGRISQALRTVSLAVPTNAVMPATRCILVEARDDGQTKLTATDSQTTITTWIEGDIEKTGSFLIPADWMIGFVSNMVSLVRIEKCENFIRIEEASDMSEAKIRQIRAEFEEAREDKLPFDHEMDGGDTIKFNAESFIDALGRVSFVAVKDDARAVLTGVKFTVSGGKATFAASDGFRLSVDSVPCENAVECDALIPGSTVKNLMRLIGKNIATIEMSMADDSDLVRFSLFEQTAEDEEAAPDTVLYSQRMSGTFPDYEALIPEGQPCKVTLPVNAIEPVTKHAKVISNHASHQDVAVRIIAEGGLPSRISMLMESDVGSSRGIVNAEIEGEQRKTALNIRFLDDLVNALPKTPNHTIAIGIDEPNHPVLFKVSDYQDFSHVMMPMHVAWEDEK